jgi:hypothetical protein
MQPWITIANITGDLLVLAAAIIDLAAAQAHGTRYRRRRSGPAWKAITARYHVHAHRIGAPRLTAKHRRETGRPPGPGGDRCATRSLHTGAADCGAGDGPPIQH